MKGWRRMTLTPLEELFDSNLDFRPEFPASPSCLRALHRQEMNRQRLERALKPEDRQLLEIYREGEEELARYRQYQVFVRAMTFAVRFMAQTLQPDPIQEELLE